MDRHEEWRPIPGFPDYRISSCGRVWSSRRGTPKLLSPFLDDGYRMIKLVGPSGRRVKRAVHALVARAFIGPRPAGLQIRHLDGNSTNNSISNLAYGTASENELDKVRHGTHLHAKKTHCPANHPYSPENTESRGDGSRRCRTCHRAIVRASAIRVAQRAAGIERAA